MNWTFRHTFLCTAALPCLLGLQTLASGMTYSITVMGGGHDRKNTPVTALVVEPEQQANLNPAVLGKAQSVKVTDEKGNELPAQLTVPGLLNESANRPGQVAREIHFVVPSLKKGRTLKVRAVVSPEKPKGKECFAWKKVPGEYAELSFGKRPVLRYTCLAFDDSTGKKRHDSYKVFHHLYNPAGTQLVTKGPGGLYTHHRGIFFGFNNINYAEGRIDIWHCSGDTHQTHEGFIAEEAGPVLGRHMVAVGWHGKGKKVFAREKRELCVYNLPGGILVEFASRLSSDVGKVKLDGDPQHAGFQFRASQKVAGGDQKLTYYLRTDGKGAPGETRNWGKGRDDCANRPWNAMSFVIDGNRYTAVYIDKPTNPKPARYSERAYGRFGSYFAYELDKNKDLLVNYRIWLQDGEMTVEEASALYADLAEPIELGR